MEAGDKFGYALAAGSFDLDVIWNPSPGVTFSFSFADDLAIGVPGEDFVHGGTNRVDAGKVHVVYGSLQAGGLTATGARIIDQSDMAGSNPEVDDHFGHTLTVGNFDGNLYDDLAVASPYEDSPSLSDVGIVQVMYSNSGGLSTSIADTQMWHEGVGGIPDAHESGDQFAKALAAGDFNGDGYDDLAAGVRLEDFKEVSSSLTNAGAVQVFKGSPNKISGSLGWYYQDFPQPGGFNIELRFTNNGLTAAQRAVFETAAQRWEADHYR